MMRTTDRATAVRHMKITNATWTLSDIL